jgi:hypothetical protein
MNIIPYFEEDFFQYDTERDEDRNQSLRISLGFNCSFRF